MRYFIKKIDKFLGLIDQIILSFGNFLLTIILSKILMPNEFGSFSLIWMSAISLAAFFSSWFASPMLSIAPTLSEYFSYKFVSRLLMQLLKLLSINALILLLIFFLLVGYENLAYFTLIGSIIPFLLYDFMRRLIIFRGRLRWLTFINATVYFGLIFCVLYFSGGDFEKVAKIIFIFYFFGSLCLLTIYFFSRQSFNSDNEISSCEIKSIDLRRFEFSKWASASSVLQFFTGNATAIFATFFLPIAEIGLLRLAQTLTSIFNPVLIYLDNHARIRFARMLKSSGFDKFNSEFKKFSVIFSLVSFFIFSFLAITADELIAKFYPEFMESNLSYFLKLYLLLMFFIIGSFLMRLRLLVCERTREIFIAYLVSSIFLILIFFPIVSLLSGVGVVLVTIIAQLIMIFVLNKSFNKVFQTRVY